MKGRPILPRERARQDILEAVDFYRNEADEAVAIGFVDALERAFEQLGRFPATGSSRWAHELDLPGVRVWRVAGYPYLVFYVEHRDHIDVWRVLHARRDVPVWMRDSDEPEG